MNNLKAKAIIATCIDFRLQDEIDKWIDQNFQPDTFDRVSLAGDVKNLNAILDQVKIAHDLHHIEKVILINHEDCGAYSKDGTYEQHVHDLKSAESKIEDLYPDLTVEIYYLHLNGEFEKIL
jgi:carbonic anhydrase